MIENIHHILVYANWKYQPSVVLFVHCFCFVFNFCCCLFFSLVTWGFSLLCFATAADALNGGSGSSQFEYLIAAGVLTWIYVTACLVYYCARNQIDRKCLSAPIIELVGDGVMLILLFAAGCAAASKCVGCI
jgi:hypothetical protein